MSNNNKTWVPLTANVALTEEQVFEEWHAFERRFGEYGAPGFSELYTHSSFPSINTVDKSANIRWTLYRGDDGNLLGFYGCYINKDGVEQAFDITVHPDHQRQGIGTKIAKYNIERYERETGLKVDYEQSVPSTNLATESGVQFANKLVQNVYDAEGE